MTKWLDEKILIAYWEQNCNKYVLQNGKKINRSDRNPSFGAYPDILRNELDTGEVVPCEIEWATTNFYSHGHDINILIEANGFLVTLIENSAFDVPQVKIDENDFIEWFTNKSKNIASETIQTIKKATRRRTDPFVWVIYISKRAEKNFEIALKEGVWGFAEDKNKNRRGLGLITDIKKDDIVVFVKKFVSPSNNKLKTPRIKDTNKFIGNLQGIIIVKVTKGYYYDKGITIWSDRDKEYNHRFRFDTEPLFAGENITFTPNMFGKSLHKQIVRLLSTHKIQHIDSTLLIRIIKLCSENKV